MSAFSFCSSECTIVIRHVKCQTEIKSTKKDRKTENCKTPSFSFGG